MQFEGMGGVSLVDWRGPLSTMFSLSSHFLGGNRGWVCGALQCSQR